MNKNNNANICYWCYHSCDPCPLGAAVLQLMHLTQQLEQTAVFPPQQRSSNLSCACQWLMTLSWCHICIMLNSSFLVCWMAFSVSCKSSVSHLKHIMWRWICLAGKQSATWPMHPAMRQTQFALIYESSGSKDDDHWIIDLCLSITVPWVTARLTLVSISALTIIAFLLFLLSLSSS